MKLAREDNLAQQLNFIDPVTDQIGTKSNGNDKLVPYGIQNETSDFRIHVCPLAQRAYIFPTISGQKAVEHAEKNKQRPKSASQKGVSFTTGVGYTVAISHIEKIQEVLIPFDILSAYQISKYDSTSIKGYKALQIVVAMLKRNLIPLPLDVSVINDRDMQIKGGDITIHSRLVLQVKCDYKGGEKRHSKYVTGNLFLQVAECNPRGRY